MKGIGDPIDPETRARIGKRGAAAARRQIIALNASLTPEQKTAIGKKAAATTNRRRRERNAREKRETPESRALAAQAFGADQLQRPVQLPRSGRRAESNCFLKLLREVRDGMGALGWQGVICRPGAWVSAEELRPDPKYPPQPVLLEFCGPVDSSSRAEKEYRWILWRLEHRDWRQLGVVDAVHDEWTLALAPLARAALTQLPAPPEDKHIADLKRRFIKWRAWLEAQLGRTADREERLLLLSWLHREVETAWAMALPEYPHGGVIIEARAEPPAE